MRCGTGFIIIARLLGLVDFVPAQANISSRSSVAVFNSAPITAIGFDLAALLSAVVLIRQQTCLEAIRHLHPKVLQQITDAGVTLFVAEMAVARREVGGGRTHARA